ncbi:hypothetical protein XELAEV_18044786mg [Xenopus laevis]|uniref:Secreted protein n=1 Tax=Xenopus laevis TaxID=8355 RepID=A0A974BZK3_XENLA|nr:hypothetical protein XELAEV_18044786mg [Xenopus laevis]
MFKQTSILFFATVLPFWVTKCRSAEVQIQTLTIQVLEKCCFSTSARVMLLSTTIVPHSITHSLYYLQ